MLWPEPCGEIDEGAWNPGAVGAEAAEVSRREACCGRAQPREPGVHCGGCEHRLATDITYVRTHEGWLYIAVVMDLYSRKIIGWSMQPTLHRDLVIQALFAALWRRKPKHPVIIHSDQGSQYGSEDWSKFCRDNGFIPSMSRRGNCYDNAAVESCFASMKKERVRRRRYRTREEAKADIFDYIEVFYNRQRRHKHLGYRSPVDYEAAFKAG